MHVSYLKCLFGYLNTRVKYTKGISKCRAGKQAEGSIICVFWNVGCQARSIFGEEEKTTWEVAIDNFNNYMTDLNTRTDQMMEGLMSSQISRELECVPVISSPSSTPWLVLNMRTSVAKTIVFPPKVP